MEIKCRFCRGTENIGYGCRKNKNGRKRVYRCLSCGRTFTHDNGFLRMRFDKKTIVKCLELFVSGMPTRKIVGYMGRTEGVGVNHSTIIRWKRRYSKMLKEYEKTMKIEDRGESILHADETMVKVNGNFLYMWGSIEEETRYLLSSFVSEGRGVKDAKRMFMECKSKMHNDPKTVVTDGLGIYPRAFRKTFFKHSLPRAYHLVAKGMCAKAENNRIERFFGNIKDRTRTTRGGFGSLNSATDFMNLFSVHYNYIRPHMGLDGKTPAEVAGVDLELNGNKLLELIERSADWHGDNINKDHEKA